MKCPECKTGEMHQLDAEIDNDKNEIRTPWKCNKCGHIWSKVEPIDD